MTELGHGTNVGILQCHFAFIQTIYVLVIFDLVAFRYGELKQ